MADLDRLQEESRRQFGGAPRLYRAPGRVNLIGEHTDYNEGFVLPAALELATYAAIAPRNDRRLRVQSLLMNETLIFDLDDRSPEPRRDWSDYVRGVAVVLQHSGQPLSGADLMIESDLPIGAGLSSSAALEVVVGYALLDISGQKIDLSHWPSPASAPRTNSSECAVGSWINSFPVTVRQAMPC